VSWGKPATRDHAVTGTHRQGMKEERMPMSNENVGAPPGRDWDEELTAAFAVLLGVPLAAFDPTAEYALYYRTMLCNEEIFSSLEDVSSLGLMLRPAPDGARHALLSVCLDLRWGLDLARSEFEFEVIAESPLSRAIDTVPTPTFVDDHRRVLLGADLAAMLAEHHLGPADIVQGIREKTVEAYAAFRLITDGTLWDAMLAATRTGAGPEGLRPGKSEAATLSFAAGVFTDDDVDPTAGLAAERERLLAPIHDPRLREHLWSPYLDRPWDRSDDGTLLGSSHTSLFRNFANRPDTVYVAAWDLAYYGEFALALVQIGGHAPREA
jgi:hypothetical protein